MTNIKDVHWEDFDIDLPFIRWYAAYHSRGAAKFEGNNLIMGPLASKRFSIGADEEGNPVFGIPDEEKSMFLEIPWTGAAFIRKHKGHDWIVFATTTLHDKSFSMKLWFPTMPGVLAGWERAGLSVEQELASDETQDPVRLILVDVVFKKGQPYYTPGNELLHLPLTLKNFAHQKIADALNKHKQSLVPTKPVAPKPAAKKSFEPDTSFMDGPRLEDLI